MVRVLCKEKNSDPDSDSDHEFDPLARTTPISAEEDLENRKNAREVFDGQMENWPEDVEEYSRKLTSAVEGLLDHGPPRSVCHGIGEPGLIDSFDFDMNQEADTGGAGDSSKRKGKRKRKKKEVNESLVQLMKSMEETMKTRRGTFVSSPSGQFTLIILLTVVSIIVCSWLRNGVWIEPKQCFVAKVDLCQIKDTECWGPVLGKFWCHKRFIQYHQKVVEKWKEVHRKKQAQSK